MSLSKSIRSSITGSLSSIVPLIFTVCKSGACGAVCISPLASLLGVSSVSLMVSPLTQAMYPVLLIFSAVSFTVSYYKIYVLSKFQSSCTTDCACDNKKKNQGKKRL